MKKRDRVKIRKALYILVPCCLMLAGLAVSYPYVTLNFWISADAGVLKPYSRVLIEDRQPLWKDDPLEDSRLRLIEAALVDANARDRIVINLSRSEIRFGLLHRKAYVKTFLKTAIPHDTTKTSSIKVLNILKRRGAVWKVCATEDLSIE